MGFSSIAHYLAEGRSQHHHHHHSKYTGGQIADDIVVVVALEKEWQFCYCQWLPSRHSMPKHDQHNRQYPTLQAV